MKDGMDQSEVQAYDTTHHSVHIQFLFLLPSAFICSSAVPFLCVVPHPPSFSQTSATVLDGSSIRNSSGIESLAVRFTVLNV